jgi:glutamine amidotransferase
MISVAIVNYRLCNLDSIGRAVTECGGKAIVTRDPDVVVKADQVILPGVGSFAAAMRNLAEDGLDQALREVAKTKSTPLLGICLGMQLLAEGSSEAAENIEGLGIVAGRNLRLAPRQGERVPHIGWNAVEARRPCALLNKIPDGSDFYFVHSYHLVSPDPMVAATSPYCGSFASVISDGSVMGTQFHPEKSQKAGFQLLRNFLSIGRDPHLA